MRPHCKSPKRGRIIEKDAGCLADAFPQEQLNRKNMRPLRGGDCCLCRKHSASPIEHGQAENIVCGCHHCAVSILHGIQCPPSNRRWCAFRSPSSKLKSDPSSPQLCALHTCTGHVENAPLPPPLSFYVSPRALTWMQPVRSSATRTISISFVIRSKKVRTAWRPAAAAIPAPSAGFAASQSFTY